MTILVPITVGADTYYCHAIAGDSGEEDLDNIKHTIRYDVWKSDGSYPDVEDMVTAFIAGSLTTFRGLPISSYSYSEDDDGSHHFIFAAVYSTRPAVALIRWSFDTSGGTIKLTTSKNTTKYAPSGRTAPDFQSAIGVKNTGKDAEPEGVDVVIPGLKLTGNYKWAAGSLDIAYVKTIAAMTGSTNNAIFYGFAIGELLFLGMTGELTPVGTTEVQYNFLASANATGLTIGAISSIAKKGHEYLWVAFEAADDATAKKLVQRPLGIYVERVYDPADFSVLGIGT